MHRLIIVRALAGLVVVMGVFVAVPLAIAWRWQEPLAPWLWAMGIAFALGGSAWYASRAARPEDMGLREGLAITTLAWVVASLIAGLGLWLDVPGLSYIDAWFEMLSGLTTTGITVFGGWDDAQGHHGIALAQLGHGALAWRATTQLLGGIGIVVLSLALLPLLASGSGFQLYRSEVAGIESDRLAPRIIDTARILVGFYLTLTAGAATALWLTGLDPFTAYCHAASAISTGGFSTFDTSATGLGNAAAEWVLMAVMFVGGLNFALVITAMRGRLGRLWYGEEVRLYVAFILLAWAAVVLTVAMQQHDYAGRWWDLARHVGFMVISVITSAGFSTGNDVAAGGCEGWAPAAQLVLLMLVVGGACAGSTTGGMKLVRFIVMGRLLKREMRRHDEPDRLTPVAIDGKPITDRQILHVAGFCAAFVAFWALGTFALSILGLPLVTAASGALTCIANNGFALDQLGPAHNAGPLSTPAKLVCMALMLLGRLEFFGVLMTLSWHRWRR